MHDHSFKIFFDLCVRDLKQSIYSPGSFSLPSSQFQSWLLLPDKDIKWWERAGAGGMGRGIWQKKKKKNGFNLFKIQDSSSRLFSWVFCFIIIEF